MAVERGDTHIVHPFLTHDIQPTAINADFERLL
jgi:hypothetical protein